MVERISKHLYFQIQKERHKNMYEERKQNIMDEMRSMKKLREEYIVILNNDNRFANASLLKFIDTRNLSFANESRKSALAADVYSSKLNDLDVQLAVLQHQLSEIYYDSCFPSRLFIGLL